MPPTKVLAPLSHRFCLPVEQLLQRPQLGTKLAETWSPTCTVVTPEPTSTTTPAPSCPPMMGKKFSIPINGQKSSGGTMSPVTKCSSEWHNPATFQFTNTSPAFGGSTSISSIFHSWLSPHSTAARDFMSNDPH